MGLVTHISNFQDFVDLKDDLFFRVVKLATRLRVWIDDGQEFLCDIGDNEFDNAYNNHRLSLIGRAFVFAGKGFLDEAIDDDENYSDMEQVLQKRLTKMVRLCIVLKHYDLSVNCRTSIQCGHIG